MDASSLFRLPGEGLDDDNTIDSRSIQVMHIDRHARQISGYQRSTGRVFAQGGPKRRGTQRRTVVILAIETDPTKSYVGRECIPLVVDENDLRWTPTDHRGVLWTAHLTGRMGLRTLSLTSLADDAWSCRCTSKSTEVGGVDR